MVVLNKRTICQKKNPKANKKKEALIKREVKQVNVEKTAKRVTSPVYRRNNYEGSNRAFRPIPPTPPSRVESETWEVRCRPKAHLKRAVGPRRNRSPKWKKKISTDIHKNNGFFGTLSTGFSVPWVTGFLVPLTSISFKWI
jgi:hypothetical protein